jgi:NADH-quinone oxidoreductase subunit D
LAKHKYNSSSFGKMPEGNEFHADVPDYYLPRKKMCTSMESLIYHFKIVMGEIYSSCRNIPSCRRRKWRIRFYLVTDGSRTRIDYILEDLVFTSLPRHDKGALLSDAIVILSSLNVIAELDA